MQSMTGLSRKSKAKLQAASVRDADECGLCHTPYQNGERTHVGVTAQGNWYGACEGCRHKLHSIYMGGIYAVDEESVINAIHSISHLPMTGRV